MKDSGEARTNVQQKTTEESAKVLSLDDRFGVVHRGLSVAFRYLTSWKMNGLKN